MADITKITTPMIPKENIGNKFKPVSDQAFDLSDPARISKSEEGARIREQWEAPPDSNMGRAMLAPLLRETVELIHVFHKMVSLLQMGISTSEVMENPEMKQLLESLFVPSDQLIASLLEQDKSAVLFKGNAFDILRDIFLKFPENPKVRDAVVELLKTYEYNVNAENSTRSALQSCYNLLGYLFSRDREQFEKYLDGLARMLLPKEAAEKPAQTADRTPERAPQEAPTPGPRETAMILKNNLLPLLGEIVVKYNQNTNIRDIVMNVVHNIVRVDQGSPEELKQAVEKLLGELRQVANMPRGFEQELLESVMKSAGEAKNVHNEWMDKMANILAGALSSTELPAATVRSAEMLLFSMLQNQSSMMDILHFVLPMQTPGGDFVTAELYVDPDSDERSKRSGGDDGEASRKMFLAFESEGHGAFELAFLQTGRYVDFSMWCPRHLVSDMKLLRRSIFDMMAVHGYTPGSFSVDELVGRKSVAQVFPNLLNRKVGVDVRV
ncbi:MAG: hypothetical protein FWH00_02645 [Oscillospiraceae bacterium]|nr:hypothetical protein [Oscillospiraceae bacterium]